jgi:hypothetical protein
MQTARAKKAGNPALHGRPEYYNRPTRIFGTFRPETLKAGDSA